MQFSRRPHATHADALDPRVLNLAIALAELLAPSARDNAAPSEPDDAPRPLKHWADAFGVKLNTLNDAARTGRLVATFPAGKSRGRVATRAAVVTFLTAKPAAVVAPSEAPDADYLRLVGGTR